MQCFYLRRSKGPSVLLLARDKRVAIIFPQNQRLNRANQYHKAAISLAPGVPEKPHNIIPHQNGETLEERQIKYQKIIQALDRFFTWLESKGFHINGLRKQL